MFIRAAIPFSQMPTAPVDTRWDWNTQVQNEVLGEDNWARYRKAHLYVDRMRDENTKAAYKLPIAKMIDGRLTVVFRAVSASLAYLNGARAGVKVPESERIQIYRNIKRYYALFDREAPELLSQPDYEKRVDESELAIYKNRREAFEEAPANIQTSLTKKAKEHNESVRAKSKKTDKFTLAVVFWRGVGAYKNNPESVRPAVVSPEQWGLGRVNGFLYALKNGKFKVSPFDTDLLPKGHPLSTRAIRSVSRMRDLDLAPINTPWGWEAGAKETTLGDPPNWERFKMAHAWFDAELAETDNGYRLPFAQLIDGELKVVFRGVASAMGAITRHLKGQDPKQSLEGITNDELLPIYNLLKSYYERFAMDAPEFPETMSDSLDSTSGHIFDDRIVDEETEEIRSEELTNFPKRGDNKKVSLRNSNWPIFPIDFAEKIRKEYPSIWDKGGNIKGNDQYKALVPIQKRGGYPVTKAEEQAIRLREAWIARHIADFRIAGTIAQIKWLAIGERGLPHMKDLVREEMRKADAKENRSLPHHVVVYDVTVDDAKYVIDGNVAPSLTLHRECTYIFSFADPEILKVHPLMFSTMQDGTHSGGMAYEKGISRGSARIVFTIEHDAPDMLYYYCAHHPNMGNSISISNLETKETNIAQDVVENSLISNNSIIATDTTETEMQRCLESAENDNSLSNFQSIGKSASILYNENDKKTENLNGADMSDTNFTFDIVSSDESGKLIKLSQPVTVNMNHLIDIEVRRKTAQGELENNNFIIKGIASSTSVDHYGTEMSQGCLSQMADQIRRGVVILPRHDTISGGNGIAEWDEVIGRTISADVKRSPVAQSASIDSGYILEVTSELYQDDTRTKNLIKRLMRGEAIGQSIGGWFDQVRVLENNQGEVERVIVEEVTLDHIAITRAPANPDSQGLSLLNVRTKLNNFLRSKNMQEKNETRAEGATIDDSNAQNPYLPVTEERSPEEKATETEPVERMKDEYKRMKAIMEEMEKAMKEYGYHEEEERGAHLEEEREMHPEEEREMHPEADFDMLVKLMKKFLSMHDEDKKEKEDHDMGAIEDDQDHIAALEKDEDEEKADMMKLEPLAASKSTTENNQRSEEKMTPEEIRALVAEVVSQMNNPKAEVEETSVATDEVTQLRNRLERTERSLAKVLENPLRQGRHITPTISGVGARSAIEDLATRSVGEGYVALGSVVRNNEELLSTDSIGKKSAHELRSLLATGLRAAFQDGLLGRPVDGWQ